MTTEIHAPEPPGGATDPAAAERRRLVERWGERHGVHAARRLEEAEELADAVAAEITPHNTTDTYTKSWRVWQRFCCSTELPELEGSRGALVAFVTWMLREGQRNGMGYAPGSAETHLAAIVIELRSRKVEVSGDAHAEARAALAGLEVKLLKAGERRGRGKAVAADPEGLTAIATSCPDTLAGLRDKALVLTGFHYASRASEPAGLLNGDVKIRPRGLQIEVLTGKTKHSVRSPKIPYASDPVVCPVRAWTAYRERLVAEHGPRHLEPSDPAFHWIDAHGNLRYRLDEAGVEQYGLGPDGVTRAISRISRRAGVPILWTGHSLRSGLASTGRKKGKDSVAIADQGGWARHSRSMLGYMQRDEGWDDNASAGLM